MLKTGKREVLDSNPGIACRPSRSEFSVVFSETRVSTDYDPLERPPRRARPLQAQVSQADNWPLKPTTTTTLDLLIENSKIYKVSLV